MRCALLLLLLALLLLHCAAQSPLFRQHLPDYAKCAKKAEQEQNYFCLVPPSKVAGYVKGGSTPPDVVIPVPPAGVNFAHPSIPDYGILIWPLTKAKWLVVLDCRSTKKLDLDYGCQLFIAAANTRFQVENKIRSHAVDTRIVAGCSHDGFTMAGKSTDKYFTYNLRAADTEIGEKHIRCVGILTGWDLAIDLNKVQENSLGGTKLWISKAEDGANAKPQSHVLSPTPAVTAAILDFADVNKIATCDYEKLKPGRPDSSYAYNMKRVDTWTSSIVCSQKSTGETDGDKFDLLVKTSAAKEWLVVKTITCENSLLFYHAADGTKTEVVNEATVVCGERAKCTAPPPLLPCENCNVTSGCVAKPGKCEELKCPGNEWRYNGGHLHRGAAHCRKESVVDKSRTDWHLWVGGKWVRPDNASCGFTSTCWTNYPMESHVDGTMKRDCDYNCDVATLSPNRVRCPLGWDLRLQDGDDVERKIAGGLRCDVKTGNWTTNSNETLNLVKGATTSVDCLFNESADNVLLGGSALLSSEEDADRWYEETEVYFWYAFGGVLMVELLILVAVKLNDFKKELKIRWNKRRTADYSKRTPEEKFKMRPWSNPKDSTKLIDEMELYKFNLKSKKGNVKKYLCPGMWKDFALYAHEEQIFFLEALLVEFSKSTRLIKKTIPLLYKVTEKFEEGDLYKRPLHSKVVKTAFTILKVLVMAFAKRGDHEAAARIRRCLAIRASNIMFYLGYDRLIDEDKDQTLMRMTCLDALFFAGHEETEKRLLEFWAQRGAEIDTPLRKFVWAAVVRSEGGGYRTIEKMMEEQVERKAKGRFKPGNVEWGDLFEHYIYALCASRQRSEAEKFFNGILKDPSYKSSHVCAGFHAMLEVFDYNHVVSRFLFQERHSFIRTKVQPSSPEYALILQMITQYTIYWPSKETWLWKFYTGEGNFTPDEKQVLEKLFTTGTIYSEMYARVYKSPCIVDTVECWLSECEYAMEEDGGQDKTDEPPVMELKIIRPDSSGSKGKVRKDESEQKPKGKGKDAGQDDGLKFVIEEGKKQRERMRKKKEAAAAAAAAAKPKSEKAKAPAAENEDQALKLAGTQEEEQPASAPEPGNAGGEPEPGNGEQKTQDSISV